MPNLSPSEQTAVDILRGLAEKKTVVVIGKDISKEVDLYAEAGMRARLTKFAWSEKFEGWMATLDFAEFEDFNTKFETPFLEGPAGDLKTYREQGLYKPQDEYWVSLSDWDKRFQALSPLSNALQEAFKASAGQDETYTSWLERMTGHFLGLDVTDEPGADETAPSPKP